MLKTGTRHFLWQCGLSGKSNCRRAKTLGDRQVKLLKHCINLLTNAGVMILTGSLFVGGSYLFLITLAKFGW